MKWLRRLLLVFTVLLLGPLLTVSCGSINLGADWRTANRDSARLAPVPAAHPEAVVQVYSARAFNWRGIFAVHTWISTKPAGAKTYTVHQVMGWNLRHGLPVVVSQPDLPDRLWYNARPSVITDLRGAAAAAAIPKILAAVQKYPHTNAYRLWPGPNSNTFTAYVGRQVPELRLELPPTAIGKDYLANGALLGSAPSGTGFQISLLGVVGALAAVKEGLEINLLGLVFGVDPLGPAIKLPGIGRLGFTLDE
ncbi:MAG: DUF3750 domain-containing protein [Gammaproteobacteria bacterium]|nr:MAG: DUF3750 domain-containing protein [Gammaproteobacteria bacterium]